MKYVLSLFLIFSLGRASAQSQSTFKRSTATILFSSIGGGVLGLSTLSFYGKPQEHTDNITTGVLLGFILGLSYVTYDSYNTNRSSLIPNKNQEIQAFLGGLQKQKANQSPGPLFSFGFSW